MKRFALIGWMLAMMMILAIAGFGCGDDDDDDDSSGPQVDDDDDDDVADDDDDDDTTDDDDDDDTTDDDDDPFEGAIALLPGPGQEGYNEDLETLARMYDRFFHTFITPGMSVNVDITVPIANAEDRQDIEDFIRTTDGWDFEDYSGKTAFDVVPTYHKVAGLYAGVGIAADAFRYGVLRDQGYSSDEVDRARQHLLDDLETLHIAHAITGVPGVIVRGLHRRDIPGWGQTQETTPLFDGLGNPLPVEKNNGTWREDNSPDNDYPNWIWEDSCSRDMFLGWCTAFAATWEIIRDDPTFPEDVKARMQEDARQIAVSLSTVQDSGYDLEIRDADGRATYHGYINENALERMYLPWLPIKNGPYAIMALGCFGALAYVAEDQDLFDYLNNDLIADRGLHNIFRNQMLGIDLWFQSNYSGYNMVFQGAFLTSRYIDNPEVHGAVAVAMETHMYDHPNFHLMQPRILKQSMFDFVYAASMVFSNAWAPMVEPPAETPVENGIETLLAYPEPPYWDYEVINCDEDELTSGDCELLDGTQVIYWGEVGRNDTPIVSKPIPMAIRPPSNYWWRSNPFKPNGGGNGSNAMPGVDFRWAYWMGRWVR